MRSLKECICNKPSNLVSGTPKHTSYAQEEAKWVHSKISAQNGQHRAAAIPFHRRLPAVPRQRLVCQHLRGQDGESSAPTLCDQIHGLTLAACKNSLETLADKLTQEKAKSRQRQLMSSLSIRRCATSVHLKQRKRLLVLSTRKP